MADGPELLLQAALVARLRADAAVSALVGARVYDDPPDGAPLPLIRIGNIDMAADRIGCFVDAAFTFSIECHSRSLAGRVEATRIAAAVRAAVDDAPLVLPGYTLDWCDYLTQSVTRGPDGKSYIAVVAFDAAVAPAV